MPRYSLNQCFRYTFPFILGVLRTSTATSSCIPLFTFNALQFVRQMRRRENSLRTTWFVDNTLLQLTPFVELLDRRRNMVIHRTAPRALFTPYLLYGKPVPRFHTRLSLHNIRKFAIKTQCTTQQHEWLVIIPDRPASLATRLRLRK
jgi:hypothetical protein